MRSLALAGAAFVLGTIATPAIVCAQAAPFSARVVRVELAVPTSRGVHYVELAPSVGRAILSFRPRGSGRFATVTFGMREPFADRAIARVVPTVRLPDLQPGTLLRLDLALDDAAPDRPLAQVVDQAQLDAEDATTRRLADFAVFFIGIFVSLAVANAFVFAFVRDRSYLIYCAWMLVNALFATTYLHRSAWAWLWPHLSLPDIGTQAAIVMLEMLFLLAFARSFMQTARIVPRLDRLVLRLAIAIGALAALAAYAFPSVRLVGPIDGFVLFLMLTIAFVALVFVLGLAALRAGSRPARFFVGSNALVSLIASALALATVAGHEVTGTSAYLALMGGQSIEGWILFGALASRLDETIRAHLTDALTGIANRRAFDECLAREWERAARDRRPIALLLMDVDRFKAFNDTYGHVQGDRALRAIARAIGENVHRPGDICARYGGEEFAVILADTDASGASEVAETILQSVRALARPHRGSPLGILTVSIGVAVAVPQPGTSPSIVQPADAALYRAKRDGRDRAES